MATSIIPNPNPKVSADILPSDYTYQATYHVKRCTKYGNRVHIEFAAYYGTSMSTSASLGFLPSGYRPSAEVDIPAVIVTSDGTTSSAKAKIASNGKITQALSSSCRNVYIDGWIDI